jgi:hypothetical protein
MREASHGVPRRDFIKLSAAAGGAVAGLLAAPSLVREAYGAPVPVPEGARSVEGGLALFVSRFEEKLRLGAKGVLSGRQVDALLHAIDRLESFGNVGDFMRVAAP